MNEIAQKCKPLLGLGLPSKKSNNLNDIKLMKNRRLSFPSDHNIILSTWFHNILYNYQ